MSRKVSLCKPGPINNSELVSVPTTKVTSLTGEGGQLKRNMLLRGRDFQLVPSSLWKALVQWYRGSPSLPRQVNKIYDFKHYVLYNYYIYFCRLFNLIVV